MAPTLYQHQKVALSYLRTNDSFALFMEQGTGKTLVVLCRLLDLLKGGKIADALIVAPKSALGAWERDCELFDQADRELLESSITLTNYERTWTKAKNGRVVPRAELAKHWGAIVLDEGHCIKNHTSNRSKTLQRLALDSDYRYLLTGTPISNGQLENVYAELTFLEPYTEKGRIKSKIFGGGYPAFLERYCILDMYHKPANYVRVNELQEIIQAHSYRVTKAECLDLPDKLPDELVKVDQAAKAIYKKLATESALVRYEVLADNPLSRLLKLRQLCSGFIQNEGETLEFPCNKPAILRELVESFPETKKLVVFAEFKHSIAAIVELLGKLNRSYVVLDGAQKDKGIWRRFQNDPGIQVIVCQYQTANAGIDLFASDTIIYYEPTLRSGILEQSRDRIHRRGQTSKCSYIHLLTKGTVEVDIYRALANYSNFGEKLFTQYMTSYRKGRR